MIEHRHKRDLRRHCLDTGHHLDVRCFFAGLVGCCANLAYPRQVGTPCYTWLHVPLPRGAAAAAAQSVRGLLLLRELGCLTSCDISSCSSESST
jgi:hypothetical protein